MVSRSAAGQPRTVTAWRHARAIVLLPVMNTVLIPCVLLWSMRDANASWLAAPRRLDLVAACGGLALLGAGLVLASRSITLLVREGKGTLAPWDPTRELVIEGVYRCVRNPMKSGLFMILLAECLWTRSVSLLVWLVLFVLVNVIYIRVSEEPGLRKRFGGDYDRYRANVPAWFPRLHPWLPERDAQANAVARSMG